MQSSSNPKAGKQIKASSGWACLVVHVVCSCAYVTFLGNEMHRSRGNSEIWTSPRISPQPGATTTATSSRHCQRPTHYALFVLHELGEWRCYQHWFIPSFNLSFFFFLIPCFISFFLHNCYVIFFSIFTIFFTLLHKWNFWVGISMPWGVSFEVFASTKMQQKLRNTLIKYEASRIKC